MTTKTNNQITSEDVYCLRYESGGELHYETYEEAVEVAAERIAINVQMKGLGCEHEPVYLGSGKLITVTSNAETHYIFHSHEDTFQRLNLTYLPQINNPLIDRIEG